MAAEEVVGVTAADVTAIKMMVDDLIARQKKVEKGLKGVRDKVAKKQADTVKKLNASLKDHAEASKASIAKVKDKVKAARGDIEELSNMVKENQKAGMEGLKASEEMLAAGIKADKSPEKLHEMKKDTMKKPSQSKLAFLTTLAGTAAWFADRVGITLLPRSLSDNM